MEVKVGQVWKNKSGTMITIIGLDNKSAALKMATGEIGCHSISFLEWHIQQLELELVLDQQLSDLEIVQKALIEKCGGSGCLVFHHGGWVIETDEYVIAEGNDNESLLTWAKQTIGG